jgi:hypothetical protein
MDEKKVRRSERCWWAGIQRTHTRRLEWGSDLCLKRCMTPLIHSTAGMPEKNGILSLRAAVMVFSSRTEDEGEKLAVAVAYVLSPLPDSSRGRWVSMLMLWTTLFPSDSFTSLALAIVCPVPYFSP